MVIIQTTKPVPKRRAHDFYETPRPFCDLALGELPDVPPSLKERKIPYILDPGCGTGVWGQAALARWPNAIVDGAEIRDVPVPDGYRYIYRGDFRLMDHGLDYDLIIGNPPFVYAEAFVRVGLANLKEDGLLYYLLPMNFLAAKSRARGIFRHHPPKVVMIAERVSFTGDKKTDDTRYCLYTWQQGWHGEPVIRWLYK